MRYKTVITRWDESGSRQLEDEMTVEFPLTIILNGRELATLLCLPEKLESLAVGFLAAEGLIEKAADLKDVIVDEHSGLVQITTHKDVKLHSENLFRRVITSGCGQVATFYKAGAACLEWISSPLSVPAPTLAGLALDFQKRSVEYRATGGVHSAGLAWGKELVCFAEDIGRHNALDKILGECLLQGWPTADKVLLTSGRISSEAVLKAARMGVPILISRAAPTSLAVNLARELGLTLVGFARGRRFNVYSETGRIIFSP